MRTAPSPNFLQKTSELSIRRQCELLHIQRSKVYYKPVELSVEEKQRRESIMARIDYWHTQMPGIGARKLVRQLKNEGFAVGRKLVRRLMGEMGTLQKADSPDGLNRQTVTRRFSRQFPPPDALWAGQCTAGTPGAAYPFPQFSPGSVGGFWFGLFAERDGTDPGGVPPWVGM